MPLNVVLHKWNQFHALVRVLCTVIALYEFIMNWWLWNYVFRYDFHIQFQVSFDFVLCFASLWYDHSYYMQSLHNNSFAFQILNTIVLRANLLFDSICFVTSFQYIPCTEFSFFWLSAIWIKMRCWRFPTWEIIVSEKTADKIKIEKNWNFFNSIYPQTNNLFGQK